MWQVMQVQLGSAANDKFTMTHYLIIESYMSEEGRTSWAAAQITAHISYLEVAGNGTEEEEKITAAMQTWMGKAWA